jgi:hypothetical protein
LLRSNGGADALALQQPSEKDVITESAPLETQSFEDVHQIDMDEDEEEYGQPIPKPSLADSRTDH